MCSALPSVTNGTIDYSSGTTAPYDYETIATYQCNHGHVLTNGDSVNTCTGDGRSTVGEWDGAAPQCPRMSYVLIFISHDYVYTPTAVYCGTPPLIPSGSPGTPTTSTFTGTVTYSCNDGYALFGIATSTCQENATWSRPPECRGTCACIV